MRSRVNDRPHVAFSLATAEHLPLTGELHPLHREFEKWLSAGNAVTLLAAIAVFTTWSVWQDLHAEDVPTGPKVEIRISPSPQPNTPPGANQRIVFPPPPPPPDDWMNTELVDSLPDEEPAPTAPDSGPRIGGGEGPSPWPPGDGDGGGTLIVPDRVGETEQPYNAFDQLPVLLRITPPAYPELARDAGIDGTVLVRVFIGTDGKVKEARVVEGSPAFHDEAIESARTAVFKPALQGTRPVEVWIVIPVVFQLQGRK